MGIQAYCPKSDRVEELQVRTGVSQKLREFPTFVVNSDVWEADGRMSDSLVRVKKHTYLEFTEC